jgi:hypothetical protein
MGKLIVIIYGISVQSVEESGISIFHLYRVENPRLGRASAALNAKKRSPPERTDSKSWHGAKAGASET